MAAANDLIDIHTHKLVGFVFHAKSQWTDLPVSVTNGYYIYGTNG
jgi:hypothetical protein